MNDVEDAPVLADKEAVQQLLADVAAVQDLVPARGAEKTKVVYKVERKLTKEEKKDLIYVYIYI